MSNTDHTIKRAVTTIPEIIFRVVDDEVDGGYSASAIGYGIHTQGETIPELRNNVKEAVECYFDDATLQPMVGRSDTGAAKTVVRRYFPDRLT